MSGEGRRDANVLLGVFPHPDDESIAAALTFLQAARNGVATHIVTCTGGEVGENLAGIELSRSMPQQRRVEMADAARVLGLTSHVWLGHRDSGMADTDDNDHPDAFVNVPITQAAAELATHIRRRHPQVVISDNDKGSYGHPDHVRAHEVTVAAIELAADPDADVAGRPHQVAFHVAHARPVSALRDMQAVLAAHGLDSPFDDDMVAAMATPDEQITTTIRAPELLEYKRAAMLAHASQVGEDSFFFNFPSELYARFMGVEYHAVVSSSRPLDDDLRAAIATRLHPDWEP